MVYTAEISQKRGLEVALTLLEERWGPSSARGCRPCWRRTANGSRLQVPHKAPRAASQPPLCLMPRHTDVPNFGVFSHPGRTRWRVQAHWIALNITSFLRYLRPFEPMRIEKPGLETMSQLIVSFPPQRTGKVEERAGNARRAPADERGIIPDHPLDGPRRHMPPSSCFSRFDFRELEHLLFHGACRHARARVGGAGA